MQDDAASAAHVADEARPWWESRWCLALVVLLTMVPLLYPPIPPLVDLLGHMGRYRIEVDFAHSPWLREYFDFHWAVIGNLGVDLPVMLLAPLIGLDPAVKLIVLAIPPITAAGFLWVAREVHGRIPPTAFFALPFIYGHPFLFGFVNFALSVALAFVAFGLWLHLARLNRLKLRAALFVPISVIVFFAHAFGWGILGLLCFSAEAVRQHDRGTPWFRAGLNAAAHAAVMALPLAIMLIWRSGVQSDTSDWFDWKVKWRWIYGALRDRWGFFDMGSLGFTGLIFLYALVSRKLTLSRNLAFSAIVLACFFVILPRIIFGSAYADMRLVPYVLAVMLLAIRFRGDTPRGLGQELALLALAFAVMRIGATTISLAIAARDQQEKLVALDYIPRGARVASLYNLSCLDRWPLPRNSHLGGLVIAHREGFSNDQWLIPGLNLVEIKYRKPGAFASDPSEVARPNGCHDGFHRTIDQALAVLPRDDFDYLWLIEPPPFDPRLVAGMQQVWRGPGTILYRLHP